MPQRAPPLRERLQRAADRCPQPKEEQGATCEFQDVHPWGWQTRSAEQRFDAICDNRNACDQAQEQQAGSGPGIWKC